MPVGGGSVCANGEAGVIANCGLRILSTVANLNFDPSILLRGLRRGWLNLMRAGGVGSVMSVTALFGIALLAQSLLVLWLATNGMRESLLTKNDFRLQFLQNATDLDMQQFLVAARQFPSVSSIAYVTREKAMVAEKETHPDIAKLMENNAINPFNDSAIITIASTAAFDEFAAFVRHPRWNGVVDPATFPSMAARQEEIRTVLGHAGAGSSAAFIMFAAAGAAVLLVAIELVRRSAAARETDVFVERVSGADGTYVILPFATEITVLLAIALFLSLVFTALLAFALPSSVPLIEEARSLAIARGPAVIAIEFAALPVIGLAAAMIGAGRVHLFQHGPLAVV